MATHNELGKDGEKQAQNYLTAKGYRIRHTNWKSGKNELDIVAEKDGMLVVVEVKTRSTRFYVRTEESVTNAQMRRIVNAAHDYIFRYDLLMPTRFDLINLMPLPNSRYDIEHIEDAFLA